MAVAKQFKQLSEIHQGNTAATNLKMLDHIPMQHEDASSSTNNLGRLRFAQLMCTPFATAGNHSSGTYSATVSNYPDFSIKYQDGNGNDHYLVGMKVRVKFNNGITYGSVSGGTYPLLNIGGTGALPLLAQGMPMASGAATSGQTLEFTLIPYGNNYAWDADSNVRESTSDYTIYTDGSKTYQNVPKIKEYYLRGGQSASFSLGSREEVQIDAIYYGGLAERAVFIKLFPDVDASKRTIFSGVTPGHSMSVVNNTITLISTQSDAIWFRVMQI